MPRTTVARVQAILPSSTTLSDAQMQASISGATCVVDQIAEGCASHLSIECLVQIETYLSAHYAAVTENSLTLSSETESCGDGKVVYGFKFGTGINGTPFGQVANTLSGGCLKSMDGSHINMLSIGST